MKKKLKNVKKISEDLSSEALVKGIPDKHGSFMDKLPRQSRKRITNRNKV